MDVITVCVFFFHYAVYFGNILTISMCFCILVLCPSNGSSSVATSHTGFFKYWDKQETVPFFLILAVFPLMCIKSPTFFTKFNALG